MCLIVLLAVTHNAWLRWMGEYLTSGGPPCKADIIVVLAGDSYGNRVLKAAELRRAGWAPEVLVSGAGYLYGVNEGDLAIQFAVRHGYPAEGLVCFPSPGRSTEEEAEYIVAELRRRGIHRFLLVTSDYHTHRSGLVYRKIAGDLSFCAVAAADHDFTPDGWWHTREGRKTAFIEWCKTIAYALHI